MSSLVIMAIDIVILVFALVIGIPLPFCFAGAFAFVAATCGLNVTSLMVWGAKQMASLTLIAGPIFILCGVLMTNAKIIDRSAFDDLHQIHKVITGKYGRDHASYSVKDRFEQIDLFHCFLVLEDNMNQAALNVRPVTTGQCSTDEIHEEDWNHLNLFQAEKHIEIEQSQRDL